MAISSITAIPDDKDGGYLCLKANVHGQELIISLDPRNRHYQEVLDAIIAEGAACFDGDIPADLQTAAGEKQFNQQLAAYTNAVERLAQYVVADGREQVTEMQAGIDQLLDSDGTPQYDSDNSPIYEQIEVITVTAIDPVEATVTQIEYDSDMNPVEVEVENPLITKDNEERAAAQAVIDATPQAVIDEYNS
jgi:hypothetical protein